MKAKKFILKKGFIGVPKRSDMEIVEEELPPLKDTEYLAEAVYISVDPYVRSLKQEIGSVLRGQQVAKIIESRSENYPVGKYVLGSFGWRTHTVVPLCKSKPDFMQFKEGILNESSDLPISLALGVLGMTGNTAYFGLKNICKPEPGETVVVSGAAGAVGNHVGQIAKILGCKVIGIVGSDLKGKWITEELGFDHYINYKCTNMEEQLNRYAFNGVDCYFDNVGGHISSIVLKKMNLFGRICICGFISEYNLESKETHKFPTVDKFFVFNHLKIEGFDVLHYLNKWDEGVNQNMQWIREGKLKYKETITEGFENTFNAFVDMLNGNNIGKAIVKV